MTPLSNHPAIRQAVLTRPDALTPADARFLASTRLYLDAANALVLLEKAMVPTPKPEAPDHD